MIPIVIPQYEYVIMFLLIVLIVQILKWRRIFSDSHQPAFDRLVTELALPAIIFASLTTTTIPAGWVLPVLMMFFTILVCILVAWGVCRAWKLPSATTGSIVLLSAFGSTYTFASPLISTIFGPQSKEMSLGLAIGTFGVAIPFFTLGVLIAGHFGLIEKGKENHPVLILKNFLATPIFLSFVLGLCVSLLITYLHVPGAGIFSDVFTDFFVVIRHSLDLLVWIAIGLLVRPIKLRTLAPFLTLVVAVQMIVQPALLSCGAYAAGLSSIYRQVLFIMASMPAGAVAAVLADRHGCDGRLAAVLVVCTYLVSLVTIPLLLFVSGSFS